MNLQVTVNPNPFSSELSVLINGHFTMNTVLRLLNSEGNVIRVTGHTLIEGENKIKIDNLGRYASGNYFLEIKLLNGDLLEMISISKS